MRALAAIATLFLFSFSIAVSPAVADKDDDTLRVAFAEELLNLDYNYTTNR